MKTAVYKNTITKEIYQIAGVKDLAQAWRLAAFVCERNNWNYNMFHEDVKVTLK